MFRRYAKKAGKILRFFPHQNLKEINYEKNYLGSKILIGIIHSSKEMPPC